MPHFPSTQITDVQHQTWSHGESFLGKIQNILTNSGPYIHEKTTFNFLIFFMCLSGVCFVIFNRCILYTLYTLSGLPMTFSYIVRIASDFVK